MKQFAAEVTHEVTYIMKVSVDSRIATIRISWKWMQFRNIAVHYKAWNSLVSSKFLACWILLQRHHQKTWHPLKVLWARENLEHKNLRSWAKVKFISKIFQNLIAAIYIQQNLQQIDDGDGYSSSNPIWKLSSSEKHNVICWRFCHNLLPNMYVCICLWNKWGGDLKKALHMY